MDRDEINVKAAQQYVTQTVNVAMPRESVSGSVQAELDELAKTLEYTRELTRQLRTMLDPVLFDGETDGGPVAAEDEAPRCALARVVRVHQVTAVGVNSALRDMIERLRLS